MEPWLRAEGQRRSHIVICSSPPLSATLTHLERCGSVHTQAHTDMCTETWEHHRQLHTPGLCMQQHAQGLEHKENAQIQRNSQTCTHSHVPRKTQVHIQIHIRVHAQADIQTSRCSYRFRHTQVCLHEHMHKCMQAVHPVTHARGFMHMCAKTYVQTHKDTHGHMHRHV